VTQAQVALAVIEAKRFLCRADKVLAKKGDANTDLWAHPDNAALKRASLDLTKALAAMRRGRGC
jgi:hypothetical protein